MGNGKVETYLVASQYGNGALRVSVIEATTKMGAVMKVVELGIDNPFGVAVLPYGGSTSFSAVVPQSLFKVDDEASAVITGAG